MKEKFDDVLMNACKSGCMYAFRGLCGCCMAVEVGARPGLVHLLHSAIQIQSYPGYPYLGLSETSIIRTQFRTWSLFKKYGIPTKIADSATEQSTCLCVIRTCSM